MAKVYFIKKETLEGLGSSVRNLTGTTIKMSPSAMKAALDSLTIGGSGNIEISGIKDEIEYTTGNDSVIGKMYFQPPLINNTDLIYRYNYDTQEDTILGIPINLITKLSLPLCNSINFAFDASGITDVDFPSLLSLDTGLFSGCTELSNVNLPTCELIGVMAFSGCTGLTEISLPNCETVDSEAFSGCTSLTTISLPNCETVDSEAFSGCSSLENLYLPSCTELGLYDSGGGPDGSPVFRESGLTSIRIPSVLTIRSNVFEACASLETVEAYGCTLIGGSAFCDLAALSSVSAPQCLSLCDYAFARCESLESVTLAVSCIIGYQVFSDVLDPDNKTFTIYLQDDNSGTIGSIGSPYDVFGYSDDNSYDSHGCVDPGTEITHAPIPGLEIYVPENLLERFKTEWGSGAYADNIFAMPEESNNPNNE